MNLVLAGHALDVSPLVVDHLDVALEQLLAVCGVEAHGAGLRVHDLVLELVVEVEVGLLRGDVGALLALVLPELGMPRPEVLSHDHLAHK